MELSHYLEKLTNVKRENLVVKVVLVGLLIISFVNYQATQEALDARMTVLVPMNASNTMSIENNKASSEYLRNMARYITGLGFTYTSITVKKQFSELLELYAPEVVERERVNLIELAERIEKVKRLSQSLYINDIKIDKDNKLRVLGTIVSYLGNKPVKKGTTITIDYRINNGRFWLERVEAPKE